MERPFVVDREKFEDVYPELIPILERHWDELAINKEERPLNVDVDRYKLMSERDILRIYTLRDGMWGKLVGYASFIIVPNLHYKTWVNGICDVYWVDPEFRNAGWGTSFFKEIVVQLKNELVNSIYVHEKLSKPHGKLFESLGFKAIEQTYELVI